MILLLVLLNRWCVHKYFHFPGTLYLTTKCLLQISGQSQPKKSDKLTSLVFSALLMHEYYNALKVSLSQNEILVSPKKPTKFYPMIVWLFGRFEDAKFFFLRLTDLYAHACCLPVCHRIGYWVTYIHKLYNGCSTYAVSAYIATFSNARNDSFWF